METTTVIYAGLVLFVAYMVRGIAGFGSGLIAIPLLALQFPLTIVVPLVVFLDYLGSASQGLKNRDHIHWREQLPLMLFTLLGVSLGLFLLKVMTAPLLAKTLAVFIIAYAVYQLLPLPNLSGSRWLSVPLGFLGGFIGTLFGTGGPFYVIYFNLRNLTREAFRATFALNFLIDGAIRLTAYASVGFFQKDVLLGLLASLPVVAAGLFLGGRIQTGFSQDTFKRVISALLLCSGMMLLLK